MLHSSWLSMSNCFWGVQTITDHFTLNGPDLPHGDWRFRGCSGCCSGSTAGRWIGETDCICEQNVSDTQEELWHCGGLRSCVGSQAFPSISIWLPVWGTQWLEALKSLLNTPQPSANLARWEMAVGAQLQDPTVLWMPQCLVQMLYPGHLFLSRDSLGDIVFNICYYCGWRKDWSPITTKTNWLLSFCIWKLVLYIQTDEKLAKTLALTNSQYVLQDGILYHLEDDSMFRMIPPTKSWQQLFEQTHAAMFGGQLGRTSELRWHY